VTNFWIRRENGQKSLRKAAARRNIPHLPPTHAKASHEFEQSELCNFSVSKHRTKNLPTANSTYRTPTTAVMATELTVQSERAFQKQPHIFLNGKKTGGKSKVGKGGRRYYKDVGLGFRTPKTAIEGSYIGKCCHQQEQRRRRIVLRIGGGLAHWAKEKDHLNMGS
jgi:small subunit ribosomal protein S11e